MTKNLFNNLQGLTNNLQELSKLSFLAKKEHKHKLLEEQVHTRYHSHSKNGKHITSKGANEFGLVIRERGEVQFSRD